MNLIHFSVTATLLSFTFVIEDSYLDFLLDETNQADTWDLLPKSSNSDTASKEVEFDIGKQI